MSIELNKNIEENFEFYNGVVNKLSSYKEIIDIDELNSFVSDFKQKIEDNIQIDRNLRIGIVGQMKAGKSSFLNSLIFKGIDILPKAATPMTAALTKIAYSEEPKAVVEFYGQKEWETLIKAKEKYDEIFNLTKENIKQEILNNKKTLNKVFTKKSENNKSNNNNNNNNIENITDEMVLARVCINPEIKASKEVYDMAKKNNLDVKEYLGKEIVIDGVSDDLSLIGKLNDYVDANGKFTPLVKSTILYINNESVKGIEIIDTPGINDPIISRGMRTKKFLSKCDVVFLLSYAGQFMDSSDVSYLIEKLPNEGIRNIILLGSKFDSALLDEAHRFNGNLKSAIKSTSKKLEQQAYSTLDKLKDSEFDQNIYKNIKKSMPPKFISSMAYDIALNYNNLDENKKHILNELNKRFKDYTFNKSLLFDLSNIDNINENDMPRIKNEKDEILKNKFKDLIVGQNRGFKSELENIESICKTNYNTMISSNGEDLDIKYKNFKQNIKSSKSRVDGVFSNNINHMLTTMNKIEAEIKSASSEYKKVSRKTGVESESYTVSKSKWYNPFSWGKRETRYKDVEYSYASVYDAVESINKFILSSEECVREEFDKLFDLDNLKKDLINAVLQNFDMSDVDFNRDEILLPIIKVINKISIPDIDIDINKYEEKVLDRFGGETVRGSDISTLIRMQTDIITQILQDMKEFLRTKTDEMEDNLNNECKNFIDNINAATKNNLENIKKLMKDIKKYERMYNEVITIVKDSIEDLEFESVKLNA